MNKSIWSNYIDSGKCDPLKENINIDVLIIGGGITGLSVGYNLIKKNLKVALVEKNELYSGVTSKTTGKITYLQENIYSKLQSYFNESVAKEYYNSQKDAIKLITKIIRDNNIKCDLEKVDSYIFTNKETNKIEKEKELLEKFGINVSAHSSLPENVKCMFSISVGDTYVFNPIKYLNSIKNICIKNNIKIYENTNILKIEKVSSGYVCYTNDYVINSKYVVLALHYPYFLFPFMTPLKVTLKKSYIRAFKINENYKYSAINVEKPTKSIRFNESNKKIYKIELTNSHNIAIKNNEKENFDSFDYDKKCEYEWSNIDIMTNDGLPFIGQIDEKLLIGTGYNAWGMTNGVLAGKVISDIILGKKNKYEKLFNPLRKINIGKIVNFPVVIGSNIYSFINSKINKNKSWYKNIKFSKIDGELIGIYTDKDGKKHKVNAKCPHLKCNLIFNEVELTWDCPCHGSRFNIDGKCLEGPSNYDISIKKTQNNIEFSNE